MAIKIKGISCYVAFYFILECIYYPIYTGMVPETAPWLAAMPDMPVPRPPPVLSWGKAGGQLLYFGERCRKRDRSPSGAWWGCHI